MPAKYSPEKFAEVFWSRTDQSGTCWLWLGTVARDGYGKAAYGRPAHRVAYELAVGPIPEGLEIDHVAKRGCTHLNCVNPAHLEAVTGAENQRRKALARTHCKWGHLLDEANTYRRRRGSRDCRACHNQRERQKRAARRRAGA